MARLFWLSDEAWAAIGPHLPHGQPGMPRVDDLRVIRDILYVLKTGCGWRDPRLRGGSTSKVHCAADHRGRPVAFAPDPGQPGPPSKAMLCWVPLADITMAVPLLEAVGSPKRLIGDKADDAERLRDWLKARRVKAVIPSTAARTEPYPLDRKAYRRRNLIERLFCRLKNWRRVVTRCDRLARNDPATLAFVAATTEWAK